jgi:hypothetical protein
MAPATKEEILRMFEKTSPHVVPQLLEYELEKAMEQRKKGITGFTRRVLAGPKVNYRLRRLKKRTNTQRK